MHRQRLGLKVLHQAEDRPDQAHPQSQKHQRRSVYASQPVKFHSRQVGYFYIRLSSHHVRGQAKRGSRGCRPTPYLFIQHKNRNATIATSRPICQLIFVKNTPVFVPASPSNPMFHNRACSQKRQNGRPFASSLSRTCNLFPDASLVI
jgi:hypothetical protein